MSVIINIGRNPDNDIVMAESYISGHHAQLIRDEDGHWFIHDLQSSNGTFVNGELVTGPTELNEEDLILLGGSLLPWRDIVAPYKIPDPVVKPYKSKWVHYIIALAASVILFLLLLLVNEYFVVRGNATPVLKKNESIRAGDHTGSEDGPVKKSGKEIVYDFSCVNYADNKNIDKLAKKLDSIETGIINKSGVTVSLQEEIDFGNQNHWQLLKGKSVLDNTESDRLEKILQTLVAQIKEPRGFDYQLFLVDSEEINAWTSGGRIYFTTTMLGFTRNENEIAGILGHEINHNELFHINDMLRAQKLAIAKFGDKKGNIVATVNKILSSPFGKKDEVHCDLKGEDLLIGAGYDPCSVMMLWNRMARDEGSYDAIDNFLRSHPYSTVRATCIENHLRTNYNISCEKGN